MLKAGPVLQWLGIRAEESANRAKQPRFNRHESGCQVWRPIFDWTVQQVWDQHRKHGIKPNPLYALGMGRVGCMPCINCRKSELRNIADLFPDGEIKAGRFPRSIRIGRRALDRIRGTGLGSAADRPESTAASGWVAGRVEDPETTKKPLFLEAF